MYLKMMGKMEIRTPPGSRPRDGRHCDLCGCSQPAVRCDKCGCQIFCLSCDDMYHRHPKRRFHLRKAVDPTPAVPQARPVLPMKVSQLNTTNPGDPSKMPLPPPRKKKSLFGSFRKPSPSSENNSPPLPKKEYSWTDRLGSIKKFMSNRPLPPLPPTDGNDEEAQPTTNGQSRPGDHLSFIHQRSEERPPQLPQRSPRTPDFPGMSQEKENRIPNSPAPLPGQIRNGSIDSNHNHQNHEFPNNEMNQWNNVTNNQNGTQGFGTLNRQRPFMPPGVPGYPGGMHQSSSAADLHNLANAERMHNTGQVPPHYPPYPMNPHMPPHYPYPMYPQYPPNYPQYFGNSFANLSNPPTSEGDFSDSESSSRHSSKRQPFRKRAKRSQSVVVDRMAFPGQFFPFGPYPGYGPWGTPVPMEAPPSPASSIRSLNRTGRTRRRKKLTSEDDDDEEFSETSSPMSRPKSSSSDPKEQPRAPLAAQATSSEDESDVNIDRRRNKISTIRRQSDPVKSASPVLESKRIAKLKKSSSRQSDSDNQDSSENRKERRPPDTASDQQPLRQSPVPQQSQLRPSPILQQSPVRQSPVPPLLATQQQQSSSTSTTSPDSWECKHCTFANPAGNRICQVCCKTASPRAETPVSAQSRPTSSSASNRKESVSSEKECSSPDKASESEASRKDRQDMASLNSALDEAEKQISKGLEELMKLKDDIDANISKEKSKPSENSSKSESGETSKPTYKSSGKMRTSILDKLNLNKPTTSNAPVSTTTEVQTDPNYRTSDKIIEARRYSNSSSTSETFNSPLAQSPELGSPVFSNKQKRDSSCQTQQDSLADYLEKRKAAEEAFIGRPINNFGFGYGDRMDMVTSPVPPMFDRFYGGYGGMMQRSHSRASLFTGRMNDFGPMDYGPGFGFGPESMYRSASRGSLTGDYPDGRMSGFHNLRKPDYYLSMEELVERRRQDNIRAQGLELVRMIREAEQQGFNADDIQVALTHCGKQNPMEWLQENWRNMVDSVVTLSTNYGNDKKENDIGLLSENEARDALRLHKGNIWAAVTECVEGRQRKYLELNARGNFSRQEIVDALTSSDGEVEMAYAKLTKSTGKPFLMRIWGQGEGVQNQDGAQPIPDDFPEGPRRYMKDETANSDELSDDIWSEDGAVDWEDDEEEYDEERGDIEDLRTCQEDLQMSPEELKTPESENSEYCDAFAGINDRNVSSPSDDIFFVIPEAKPEKKKGFLSKLVALRRDSREQVDTNVKNSAEQAVEQSEDANLQKSVTDAEPKNGGTLSALKNTFSAFKDSVTGGSKNDKKVPCVQPERRTIIVQGQMEHESLNNEAKDKVQLISVKQLKEENITKSENQTFDPMKQNQKLVKGTINVDEENKNLTKKSLEELESTSERKILAENQMKHVDELKVGTIKSGEEESNKYLGNYQKESSEIQIQKNESENTPKPIESKKADKTSRSLAERLKFAKQSKESTSASGPSGTKKECLTLETSKGDNLQAEYKKSEKQALNNEISGPKPHENEVTSSEKYVNQDIKTGVQEKENSDSKIIQKVVDNSVIKEIKAKGEQKSIKTSETKNVENLPLENVVTKAKASSEIHHPISDKNMGKIQNTDGQQVAQTKQINKSSNSKSENIPEKRSISEIKSQNESVKEESHQIQRTDEFSLDLISPMINSNEKPEKVSDRVVQNYNNETNSIKPFCSTSDNNISSPLPHPSTAADSSTHIILSDTIVSEVAVSNSEKKDSIVSDAVKSEISTVKSDKNIKKDASLKVSEINNETSKLKKLENKTMKQSPDAKITTTTIETSVIPKTPVISLDSIPQTQINQKEQITLEQPVIDENVSPEKIATIEKTVAIKSDESSSKITDSQEKETSIEDKNTTEQNVSVKKETKKKIEIHKTISASGSTSRLENNKNIKEAEPVLENKINNLTKSDVKSVNKDIQPNEPLSAELTIFNHETSPENLETQSTENATKIETEPKGSNLDDSTISDNSSKPSSFNTTNVEQNIKNSKGEKDMIDKKMMENNSLATNKTNEITEKANVVVAPTQNLESIPESFQEDLEIKEKTLKLDTSAIHPNNDRDSILQSKTENTKHQKTNSSETNETEQFQPIEKHKLEPNKAEKKESDAKFKPSSTNSSSSESTNKVSTSPEVTVLNDAVPILTKIVSEKSSEKSGVNTNLTNVDETKKFLKSDNKLAQVETKISEKVTTKPSEEGKLETIDSSSKLPALEKIPVTPSEPEKTSVLTEPISTLSIPDVTASSTSQNDQKTEVSEAQKSTDLDKKSGLSEGIKQSSTEMVKTSFSETKLQEPVFSKEFPDNKSNLEISTSGGSSQNTEPSKSVQINLHSDKTETVLAESNKSASDKSEINKTSVTAISHVTEGVSTSSATNSSDKYNTSEKSLKSNIPDDSKLNAASSSNVSGASKTAESESINKNSSESTKSILPSSNTNSSTTAQKSSSNNILMTSTTASGSTTANSSNSSKEISSPSISNAPESSQTVSASPSGLEKASNDVETQNKDSTSSVLGEKEQHSMVHDTVATSSSSGRRTLTRSSSTESAPSKNKFQRTISEENAGPTPSDSDDTDIEYSDNSRRGSLILPSPVDTLRSRFEGLAGGSTIRGAPVRPASPFRRMSFNSRKQVILLEKKRDTSSDKPWFHKVQAEPVKITPPKKSVKQQLEMERKVRKMVADRKVRTYRKAEIVVQLMDMNFEEEEAIQAAHECSALEQAISYLQQECLLCAGHFPVSTIISMTHCEHRACRECIRAYFTVQIRDRTILDLLCPFCNEPDISDEDVAQDYFNHLDIMLKKLVDVEIHELFQRKLRDRVLMKDPNFRWCSQCSSGFIAMPNLKRLICPDCNAVTCASCRRLWEKEHQGISCEAFAALKDASDPETQAAGLAKMLTEDGISCPSCHFRYALAKGGCMHFRCIQCQHDFCSGCSRPFKMGQKCGVSEFCAKLGLHAHHPRNCLFYLRDKEPEDLQKLLEMNDIKYNREPPDGVELKNACQVMEQKETADGMVDDYCGKEVQDGYAGLCRVHYVEYLGQLVNRNQVDPIQIFDNDDLELVLKRANIRLPPKKYRETDSQYREKLINVIEEELPLDKMDGS